MLCFETTRAFCHQDANWQSVLEPQGFSWGDDNLPVSVRVLQRSRADRIRM